ncbi:MAG TPA: hypothetical protein VEW04_01245 [Allosphingosinicella sp.]|nr:hypothetical protein [Allosphingosinicella sp.]
METEAGKDAPSLRWRTGGIGCLLPLFVVAVLYFGLFAVRPAMLHDAAQGHGRVAAWLWLAEGMEWGGFNLPVALIAVYLLFETGRYGWRWADEEAARLTPEALIPHASLFMRPMKWSEIAGVRFVQRPQLHAIQPCLEIALRNGRRRLIRGVDNEGGAAERFAAEAMRRIREMGAGSGPA